MYLYHQSFKDDGTKNGVKSFDSTSPFKLGEQKDESADFNKNIGAKNLS